MSTLRDAREPRRAGARAARRFRRTALGRALSRRAPRRSAQRAHRAGRSASPTSASSPVPRSAISRCTATASPPRSTATARSSKHPAGCWSPPTACGRACAAWPARRARAAFPAASPGAPAIRADGAGRQHARRRSTEQNSVTAFLHPSSHMIVYPLRGGDTINLVAVTAGEARGESWSGQADPSCSARRSPAHRARSSRLIEAVANWTVWPIHTVEFDDPWTLGGAFALIGDAAHAMTPYAAQGAAMAIEDAVTLAAASPSPAGCGAGPRRMGGRAAAAHREGDPPRRAQPLRLACLGTGGAGAQPVPEDALAGEARGRPRLAVRLAAAGARRALSG